MNNQHNKQLTVVISDGIKNSVFGSQVIQPLLKQIELDENLEITLVSFEVERPSASFLMETFPAHGRFHLVLCRRLKYFGKISLYFAAFQLKKLLKKLNCDEILARGPLAGWVTMNSLERGNNKQPKLTIQARGLCAEEYRYTCQIATTKPWNNPIRRLIYKSLKNIEREVYHNSSQKYLPANVSIEAVSTALKDFLVQNFNAESTNISISTRDLLENFDKKIIHEWRTKTRTNLKIPSDAIVYCYSGSHKPWQCATESINYFIEQHKRNHKNFMLVLSPDKEKFVKDLQEKQLPTSCYCVLKVKHNDLFQYLAAADHGLMFRKKDVVNWVSRPTKALEYKAVGLSIIHNNTVSMLVE
jgi:hypothetical protein